MPLISIFISKALGYVTDNETLTSGMVGAKVQLDFGEEWSGLQKTAIFKAGEVSRAVVQSEWDGNVCSIPHEVLRRAGEALLIGIYGVNENQKIVIPTVWVSIGAIRCGVDPSADASTSETLPVWAQIQATANSAKEVAEKAKELMESGMLITCTYNSEAQNYTVDKSFDEIASAIKSGKLVMLRFGMRDYSLYWASLIDGKSQFADFSHILIGTKRITEVTFRVYNYTTDTGSNVVRTDDITELTGE